jgi:2-oxoglutarate dehydrogenase E2 component (dihydrolipoamide succinyltransferase)
MLTTFQEVDMSRLIDMRNTHKEQFEKAHGVKLGFMSAFVKVSGLFVGWLVGCTKISYRCR